MLSHQDPLPWLVQLIKMEMLILVRLVILMCLVQPPILVFSPANRVTDNSRKDTLENILETKEVVINLVDFSLVEPTSLSSVYYEKRY